VYIRLLNLNVFACVFLVASRLSIVCQSVQHKSESSEQFLANISEKISNDKICDCTAIPCSLLIGYRLAII